MLTSRQTEDLAQLHLVARQFQADVVMIGAGAIECFIELGRSTKDIDLVIALDLEDFASFAAELREYGWLREHHQEHRWRGPNGSLIDLLPAGPNLRASKQFVWSESHAVMSLIGFDHVFAQPLLVLVAHGFQCRVAPLPVIAILKIVAYMDDPHRRKKNRIDLALLFRRYEAASDRIFSDDVFEANFEDIEHASAFLLGIDVGTIATSDELILLEAFIENQRLPSTDLVDLDVDDFQQREALRFQQGLLAFRKGLTRNRRA